MPSSIKDGKSEKPLQDAGFPPSSSLASSLEWKSDEKIDMQESPTPTKACSQSMHMACSHGQICKCGLSIPDLTPSCFGVSDLSSSPPPPYSAQPEPVHKPRPSFILHGVELSDRSLGKGSYGSVVAATYNSLPVAAKSMHSVLRVSLRYTAQFQNEWETLHSIRHPNIVMFMGVYEDNNAPYLIMELVEGGSLYQLVDSLQKGRKEITLYQKSRILYDISLALEYLHNTHNIVHRDLSSPNVLLTRDLRAKVSDLGMSRPFIASNQPSTQAPGCLLYMPPEALVNDNSFTQKGDIFSFAVIVVELMIEEHPRPRSSQTGDSEVNSSVRDIGEFCRQAPEMIKEHVLECLQDDPDLRPDAKCTNQVLKCFTESLDDSPSECGARVPLLNTGVRQPQQASDSDSQITSPLILPNDRDAQRSFLCADNPMCFPTSESQEQTEEETPVDTQHTGECITPNGLEYNMQDSKKTNQLEESGNSHSDGEQHGRGTIQFLAEGNQHNGECLRLDRSECNKQETSQHVTDETQNECDIVNLNREQHTERTCQFVTEVTETEDLNWPECNEVAMPTATEESQENDFLSSLVVGISMFSLAIFSTAHDVHRVKGGELDGDNYCISNSTSETVYSGFENSINNDECGIVSSNKPHSKKQSSTNAPVMLYKSLNSPFALSSICVSGVEHLRTRSMSFVLDMHLIKRHRQGKIAVSSTRSAVGFFSIACKNVVSVDIPASELIPRISNTISATKLSWSFSIAQILKSIPQYILQHLTSESCVQSTHVLPKEHIHCKGVFSACKSSTLNKPLRSRVYTLLRYFVYLHWCKTSLTYLNAPVTLKNRKQLKWLMSHYKSPDSSSESALVAFDPGVLVAHHNDMMDQSHTSSHLFTAISLFQQAVQQAPAIQHKVLHPRGNSVMVVPCNSAGKFLPAMLQRVIPAMLQSVKKHSHYNEVEVVTAAHRNEDQTYSKLIDKHTLSAIPTLLRYFAYLHWCKTSLTYLKAPFTMWACKQLNWFMSHHKIRVFSFKDIDTATERALVKSAPGIPYLNGMMEPTRVCCHLSTSVFLYYQAIRRTSTKVVNPRNSSATFEVALMCPKLADELVLSLLRDLIHFHWCITHLVYLKLLVRLLACRQLHQLTSHYKKPASPLKSSDIATEGSLVRSASRVLGAYCGNMLEPKHVHPHLQFSSIHLQQVVQQTTAIQHTVVYPSGNSTMAYSYTIYCRSSPVPYFMDKQCASIAKLDVHLCCRHTMLTVKPGEEMHTETCFELKISKVFLARMKYSCPDTARPCDNAWVNQYCITKLSAVTTRPSSELSRPNRSEIWNGSALHLLICSEPKNESLHFPVTEAAFATLHPARGGKKSAITCSTTAPTFPLTLCEDTSTQWLQPTMPQCVHSPTQCGDQITVIQITQPDVFCGKHHSQYKATLYIPMECTFLRGRLKLYTHIVTGLEWRKPVGVFLQEPWSISSHIGGGTSYNVFREGIGFVGKGGPDNDRNLLGDEEEAKDDDGNRKRKEELRSGKIELVCSDINDVAPNKTGCHLVRWLQYYLSWLPTKLLLVHTLKKRHFGTVIQVHYCQYHPDSHSSTFIHSLPNLVLMWNVRKKGKHPSLGVVCEQGEASISAPLFNTFFNRNPLLPWFLVQKNLQLARYHANNPVAEQFARTYPTLSCNVHHFTLLFQLMYKVTTHLLYSQRYKPESLPLDLRKPVRVLSSPQSQGTSSSTGGGNNSSESGKGSSSGDKGGARNSGSSQRCQPGNSGDGGKRDKDDDGDRKRKPKLSPKDDKDAEQSEEESSKWHTQRKTGPQAEPHHLLDSKRVTVRKTPPPADSKTNESVQRTKYDSINGCVPLLSHESSSQPPNGNDEGKKYKRAPKRKSPQPPAADLQSQNTETEEEDTPDQDAILEPVAVDGTGQCDSPNASDLNDGCKKPPSHNAEHACKAPSPTTNTHPYSTKCTLGKPMKCFCGTSSTDNDSLVSTWQNYRAPQEESETDASTRNQKLGSDVVVGYIPIIRYYTTASSASTHTNGGDGCSGGHSEDISLPENFPQPNKVRPDNSIEPEDVGEGIKGKHAAEGERSKHDIESHGWEEAEEMDWSLSMGDGKVHCNNTLGTDDVEQATECEDSEETSPTITSHTPAPPYDMTPFCVMPESNAAETEVPLGRGTATFSIFAIPSAVEAETSNDFNVVPMEECPVEPRLYQELHQSGIRPLHSSHSGGK